MSKSSIPSAISTGGGGTHFEHHVDALFLALLLLKAPLPVAKDCQILEVHLQSGHLGWMTDDLLIVGTKPGGLRRSLLMQVKRQFVVSDKDDICIKTIEDFWGDFKSDRFDQVNDRFALVTLRGTNSLLEGFNGLLDCARATSDSADFERRITKLSKVAQRHAKAVRTILAAAERKDVDNEEFHLFLRALHVLSFDLNTASAQNEMWIKTLLAHSATGEDSTSAAEASWGELLGLAGLGMPVAASYLFQDLPLSLRERHSPVDSLSGQVLRKLREHSDVTLRGIRTTIGAATQIEREALMSEVLETLEKTQIVILSAAAGSGKSVIAKHCLALLGQDQACMAFRAEEFAVSHIDRTLHDAQIPANGATLLAILAGQSRKLVLVDSVERLLEASIRDAFADLLGLAKQDGGLTLILSCRDYSLETVSSALLERAGITYQVVEVPLFSDEELDQALAAQPQLANAVRHGDLKRLLHSPYLLNMAAGMDWSDLDGLPRNEREFRRRCWAEVIRSDAAAADGMPQRREQVFLGIALRRAKDLRPFVDASDLDALAVARLRNDSLIVGSPEVGALVAPAHDVLEDWAIIHWLGYRWKLHERAALSLERDIAGYPAIRRAYRRWLSEELRANEGQALDFILSVFRDEGLSAYFRDDSLVCVLQSAAAAAFLSRHRAFLLANGSQQLIRLVHLLRVACKETPFWIRRGAPVPSILLVPSGEAWPAILELVESNLEQLVPTHTLTVVGLVEDFAQLVSWNKPEPRGFKEAARIAFKVLNQSAEYFSRDLRERVLKIISKIPHGDPDSFRSLVERASEDEDFDSVADDVAELLLQGLDGWNACQHFPEEMIGLAKSQFLLQLDESRDDSWGHRDRIGVEEHFGIKERAHFGFFPASAIRSLFFPLLRFHPHSGIEFLLGFLNHAGSWYGKQIWQYNRLEPASSVAIMVPGEDTITQWANFRLWSLYRGISAGPEILQTALMALEKWLLELCELEGVNVEQWLLKVLKESNSVMATALVASVCNAHPTKAGKAALAILSSRELFSLDRSRAMGERRDSSLSGLFPNSGTDEIYEQERKTSNALPHRGHDLEALALKLQMSGENIAISELIDRHREALPPVDQQSDDDRLWRLALHRIDMRGFQLAEESAEDISSTDEANARSSEKRIVVRLGQIESDVQELLDKRSPELEQQGRELSLLNWGLSAWEKGTSADPDDLVWRIMLRTARIRSIEPEPVDYFRGGPGMIAATCVRDHWAEMPPDDREWCISTLCFEVERQSEGGGIMGRYVSPLGPSRQAAFILPALLAGGISDEQSARVKAAVAIALTHQSDEVAMAAAEGLGSYLAGDAKEFSAACAAAIARQSRELSKRLGEEKQKPYQDRLDSFKLLEESLPDTRSSILNGNLNLERELGTLSSKQWPGTRAARLILMIFRNEMGSTLALSFHLQMARSMVAEWEDDVQDRSRRGNRDYHFKHECLRHLARFVLRHGLKDALQVCAPLLDALPSHPEKVREFVRDLIEEEDRQAGETPFWEVWQAFAEAILRAPWIKGIDARHSAGGGVIGAIFLGVRWKENVHHWSRLAGEGYRIDDLARKLQGSSAAFSAYCNFLYSIGETSLPGGFAILAELVQAGGKILSDSNTVYLVESLLRRHVYAEPLKLKSDARIRSAILKLLDSLVEAGSSAAYRMRDDFVTPLKEEGRAVR